MASIPIQRNENQISVWGNSFKQLVSGGIAGAISRTCTAPIDRVKIFLQVEGGSARNCWKRILKEGGTSGLWRGNGVNVMKIAPETALKFFFFERAKEKFKNKDSEKELGFTERVAAGAIAGGLSQTIIYPLEVLKTRLALGKTGEFNGIFDAVIKLVKYEGVKSLYKGYVPNILGILPYSGIELAVYETLKNAYIRKYKPKDGHPNTGVLVGCAIAATTCGQTISYPLSVIRTKMQAQGGRTEKPQTMTQVFKDIIAKQGFRGLYKGAGVNFLKVAPSVSISYIVYEYAKRALGVERAK